jgi:lysine-N-methylase
MAMPASGTELQSPRDMAAPDILTARYMTRFQCVGGACEETCCAGWKVQVDRRHYQILKKGMDRSKAEREEFREAVQRERGEQVSDAAYAHLNLRPDGSCHFLDAKKLCSAQSRFGEKALPQVCAVYPRHLLRNEEQIEVWATFSCPEIARQGLLHEDALDIVDGTPEISSRLDPHLGQRKAVTPYQRYLGEIRRAAFHLLSMRDYPIATRLFMVAYLGKQTASFFNKEAAQLDDALLVRTVEQVCNPARVAAWHRELGSLPAAPAVTANLVNLVLTAKMKLGGAGSFAKLLDASLTSYGATLDPETGAPTLSLADLWSAYASRRDAWTAGLSDRIDLYFENYAKNYWMSDWYTRSPDLLAHAQQLLVRVAVLRFALFSHPDLQAGPGDDLAAGRATLDRVAVEVFYKFSRAIEHDPAFLQLIASHLVEQGMQNFTHAAILALV